MNFSFRFFKASQGEISLGLRLVPEEIGLVHLERGRAAFYAATFPSLQPRRGCGTKPQVARLTGYLGKAVLQSPTSTRLWPWHPTMEINHASRHKVSAVSGKLANSVCHNLFEVEDHFDRFPKVAHMAGNLGLCGTTSLRLGIAGHACGKKPGHKRESTLRDGGTLYLARQTPSP
jgi:hypothetical protein